MQVSLDTQIPSSLYGDNSGPASPRRLNTRDPQQYRQVVFDQVGAIHLAHRYDNSELHVQIFEVFTLLSSTGIGRTVLADLKALSALGVRIAIGPRDDADANNVQVSPYGVGHTVDGAVLWDCDFPGHGLNTPSPAPEAYRRLIRELAQVRNLAAESVWQGCPTLRPDDAESAFMAELAAATAPAFAASRFCPPFPIWSAEPDWPRGPTYFDPLETLMPAWLTEEGRLVRDEVVSVLRLVQETPWGRRLLNDIWVYGRSRAVTLIHYSASGREGVHKVNNDTPIWCYNRAALERRAQSEDLTEREARASGAFVDLLRVRGALATKLGMLEHGHDLAPAQRKFEDQLIETRRRRTVPPVAPPPPALADPGSAPARRPSIPSVRAPSGPPSAAADVPPARPAPAPAAESWVAGQEDITAAVSRQARFSRRHRIARWMQESMQLVSGRAPSTGTPRAAESASAHEYVNQPSTSRERGSSSEYMPERRPDN
ncbi:hypothetical protein BOSP111201_17945 [Bordetella sputigena]|uniref:hypothetical protein n=1 Tax=Bordetella sputigena TaxID=1416810 RepID=UPI0039F12676